MFDDIERTTFKWWLCAPLIKSGLLGEVQALIFGALDHFWHLYSTPFESSRQDLESCDKVIIVCFRGVNERIAKGWFSLMNESIFKYRLYKTDINIANGKTFMKNTKLYITKKDYTVQKLLQRSLLDRKKPYIEKHVVWKIPNRCGLSVEALTENSSRR